MTENHVEWSPELYYCENSNVSFVAKQALSEDDECPWCHEDITDLVT